MDILFLIQIVGLIALIATLIMAIIKSHKTIMRLNYIALLIGAGLVLYADIAYMVYAPLDRFYYQAGITVLVIVTTGLIPSLRQVEKLWNIKI